METAFTATYTGLAAAAIVLSGGTSIAFLAISAGSMLLFNAATRVVMAELIYRNQLNPSDNKKILIEALSYIAPISFGLVNATALDTYFHNSGLEFARDLQLSVKPSLVGLALSLFASTAILIGSYATEDSSPEASKYLFFMAITNIAIHAFKALVDGAKNMGIYWYSSDYWILVSNGPLIHPLITCAGIVAIPFFVKLAFVAGYYVKQRALQNVTNQI